MKIVKVQGGSGNQLFQASKTYSTIKDLDTPIILFTHALSRYAARSDLFKPAWQKFDYEVRNDLFIRMLLKLDRVPVFQTALRLLNIHCTQGYFQEEFSLDYARALYDELARKNPSSSPSFDGVIHCRGGDYLVPPNVTIYKQIELREYTDAIGNRQSGKWAVVGNHVAHSSSLANGGVSPISGTIAEDLLLMGATKLLVCSNSTFAFWGGLFCLLNGGQILAPKQYYVDSSYAPNPFNVLADTFCDQVKFFGDNDA